jgi:isoleucyl-tRNA synthetase
LHSIFHVLVRVLAPVLTFTSDEAWSYATSGVEYTAGSVHLEDWPVAPANWENPGLVDDVAALLRVRAQVNEAIEPLRAAGKLGKSLDAAITLAPPAAADNAGLGQLLARHAAFLPELFIVSQVTMAAPAGAALAVSVQPCSELGLVRCPRCWRWVPALVSGPAGDTCPRCAEALNSR